ncbi:MAG: hypothetical protein L0Y66_27655 [Myxococcaceae bacterium]|nr:hypothetical protein [Myxococcaceae bacterium]MCI0670612.1 hypothetical protein [Myxococcaceae bacterium]
MFGGSTLWGLVVGTGIALAPSALAGECKEVHADLVEVQTTSGFEGNVEGNHGLRGTTHFKADSAAKGPSTSPGWISYSGYFTYKTASGDILLVTRETGVTGMGRVTAFQVIIDGYGEFSGATGYFFVSGSMSGDPTTVVTQVTGEICLP